MPRHVTLGQLIENLQELIIDGRATEDSEVRLAFQPSWPLQYHLSDDIVTERPNAPDEDEMETATEIMSDPNADPSDKEEAAKIIKKNEEEKEVVVYLAESGQVYDDPYLPDTVSKNLGWDR